MAINYDCTHAPQAKCILPSLKSGPVFITARSLFLNEKISSFLSPNLGIVNVDWNMGSYSSNLKLDDAVLNGWRGKEILDVGAGASLFAEEAATVYGIKVTNLDLNVERCVDELDTTMNMTDTHRQALALGGHVQTLTTKAYARQIYARNLEWIWCQKKNEIQQNPAMFSAFEKIFNKRYSIGQSAYTNPNTRRRGDATQRNLYNQGAFDVLLSVWVFNYLDRQTKRTILENMIYWAKTPAEIRICGGRNRAEGSSQDADLTPATFRNLFYAESSGGWVREWTAQMHGRKVTVDPRSDANCLILKVATPQGWFW